MCSPKDTVLSTLMKLPQKTILNVRSVALDDLIHTLCGNPPDAHASENVKSILASLECDGKVTLVRMETGSNNGPILGIHLNRDT